MNAKTDRKTNNKSNSVLSSNGLNLVGLDLYMIFVQIFGKYNKKYLNSHIFQEANEIYMKGTIKLLPPLTPNHPLHRVIKAHFPKLATQQLE